MTELTAERPSSLALLPGIIDRPGATLAEVIAHPRWRWVLPAILCLLGLVISIVVSAPFLSQEVERQQAVALQQVEDQMGNLSEAQRAQMQAQITRFTGPAFLVGVGLLTGVLGLAAGWLVGAAILYFGLLIGGRELGYGQVFAGFSWTWLPFFLRDLVQSIWILATGQDIPNPGLSYFFASGDPQIDAGNPLWILTGNLDLFFLWHVVLVYFLWRAWPARRGGLGLTLVYLMLTLTLRVLPPLLLSSLRFGG